MAEINEPVTALVSESALYSDYSPLVGQRLIIKKRLKTKTNLHFAGTTISIPNRYLDFT